MKKIINPTKSSWSNVLQRPTQTIEAVEETVLSIFKDIERNGDVAVKRYTTLFDGVDLDNFLVSNMELENASNQVSKKLKTAIKLAKCNIEKFHKSQKQISQVVETSAGVKCWQETRAVEKVGLYIPGGTAPLFSSVLMLAVPAQIAGCKEIILCTPPNKQGNVNPAILYAAKLCGVTKIIKVGGIQAVAGLTFGTISIPKVYKIFGPGNQFVTAAKQLATKFGVAIDMPAGPSELLVVADATANPTFVASDLLSQAEHGVDSQVILISTSFEILEKVEKEIIVQLNNLPRKQIAEKAIENSRLIYVESDAIALEMTNEYGPEHFIISTKNPEFYGKGIVNAGSVFIGNYTPESAGDYASGTNHTLPTNGFSKAYSGVNLNSFLKTISFQEITRKGLLEIGESIEELAAAEGLHAHKNAVTLRLKSLK